MPKQPIKRPPEISPELSEFISVVQKATAFDFVVAQRAQLAEINKKLQALTKLSGKKNALVVSQYLGMRTELQRSIDMILAGHAGEKE